MYTQAAQTAPLILVGLNEINFDYVRWYAQRGDLPNLESLIRDHGVQSTTSEQEYEELEPWIQWVSIQTGKSLAEHRVFRLGDITECDLPQYFEILERHGIKVGAVSPMNAANRLKHAPFFVPDPWTKTPVSGGPALERLTQAIARVVNNNSERRVSPVDLVRLAAAYLRHGSAADLVAGFRALNPHAVGWRLAIVLDRLLAALFINLVRRHRPGFSAVFLNAGAHIQHHYMFESAAYNGPQRNPPGYIRGSHDPLLEIYSAYDDIVGRVRTQSPDARLILATALHQDPYPKSAYYWRLKDHTLFLASIGVKAVDVEPRMSRDFLVRCRDQAEIVLTVDELQACIDEDGRRLFDVDAREGSVFVTLLYDHDITETTRFFHRGRSLPDPRSQVAFVAVKNGQHNAGGYVVDTVFRANEPAAPVPVWSLFDRVIRHFGLSTST